MIFNGLSYDFPTTENNSKHVKPSWLYREADYPEYFKESQQQWHFLEKYSG